MATKTQHPTSRRALLSAAIGAGAAGLAAILGRPVPTKATNGGSIILGFSAVNNDGSGSNEASATTLISTNGGDGFVALTTGAEQSYGIWGISSGSLGRGVSGLTEHGDGATQGVFGEAISSSGTGVFGLASSPSGQTFGIHGHADSTGGIAVYGSVYSPTGATYGSVGESASTSGTGVFGIASADTGPTRGVLGQVDSPGGTGVQAYSGPAAGLPAPKARTAVFGQANQGTNGVGVRGHSASGTGLYGSTTTGYALRAVGRVKLDDCAGVATVGLGANTVVVTPGVDLVSTSAVVATLLGDAGGSTTVKRVAVNATSNTFTIVLTANSAAAVKVAWIVLG